MKTRTFLSVLFLMGMMAAQGPALAREVPDAAPPALTEAGFEEDDLLLLEDDEGATPPDLRVMVAAPRAAVIKKASAILLVMRPGRILNIEAGERVRFLAGVREAVWYRGSGVVESHLRLSGRTLGNSALQLGEDLLVLSGSAPAIDRGRTRVDLTFDQVGEYGIEAAVRAGVKPRTGKARGDARSASYLVRVHEPGFLGSIEGFVGNAKDGSPLTGYPVVALDAGTLQAVDAARSGQDGSFMIGRLPPGSYLVVAPARRGFEREFFNDSPDASGATPVTVSSGATSGGLDFLLEWLDRP